MISKRLSHLSVFLALLLLLSTAALADGDPNVDVGGGNTGVAITSGSYWTGDDGVRISVVTTSGSTVACFDWANRVEDDVQCHFGKVNKIAYHTGASLTPHMTETSSYSYRIPANPMPAQIVGRTKNGNNARQKAIKSYFTDKGVLENIAAEAGIPYDEFKGGDYKILIEPMVYIWYDNMKFAMTATEAALYDVITGGQVKYYLGTCTHQNLPCALFLEESDLGLSRPTSTLTSSAKAGTTGKMSNLDIINYFGCGIITFEPKPEEDLREFDYEFHCDTDVIVSFPIYSSVEITPDDNAFVTLNVGNTNYHRQFICPEGGVQLIWVQWHTPSTPCELTMTATGAGSPVTLHVKVILLEEVEPPDPTFYDTNSGFTLKPVPTSTVAGDFDSCTHTTWGEWFARWIQEHGLHYGGTFNGVPYYYTCTGYCREHGYWEFYYVSYEASLNCTFELKPDDNCPTDYTSGAYGTVMPSGYGVQAKVTTSIMRGAGVSTYDVTPIQFVVSTFPEFHYETYNRLLEKINGSTWNFKQSIYSLHHSRIHYTPLWYPDDTYYPVAFQAIDAWTPGGQLHMSKAEQVYIFQSCIDDWYIHNIK